MRLKPNDSPVMEVGEIRNFTFNWSGAVGSNTIQDFTAASPNLTLGAPAFNDTRGEVLVTASSVGTHALIATAVAASGETFKGFVRVKVIDSSMCETGGRDYG